MKNRPGARNFTMTRSDGGKGYHWSLLPFSLLIIDQPGLVSQSGRFANDSPFDSVACAASKTSRACRLRHTRVDGCAFSANEKCMSLTTNRQGFLRRLPARKALSICPVTGLVKAATWIFRSRNPTPILTIPI